MSTDDPWDLARLRATARLEQLAARSAATAARARALLGGRRHRSGSAAPTGWRHTALRPASMPHPGCPAKSWPGYDTEGRPAWFRLHEKGGKRHEVPAHHSAADYLDAYLEAAGIGQERKGPLFRSINRSGNLTDRPIAARNALDMIKRRAKAAGLPEAICCHTFRATGITAYLRNGGTIENAQAIANHESPKTTKLYDRTSDQITLGEFEKITI